MGAGSVEVGSPDPDRGDEDRGAGRLTRIGRWFTTNPLSDWRWPAAAAAALFAGCVLVALLSIGATTRALTGTIRARGEQSLCQQGVEAEFEKAVGHALTVDRTDATAVLKVREDIAVAVAKLEHVADICPTK